MTRAAPAILVAGLAFLLYHSTRLPGFDFGDTPSFQVMAGAPAVTPRDAYPLYFGISRVFASGASDPAGVLNALSAVTAALACGVIVLVGAELSGSIAAGAAAALLFSTSYTFWSQAIIAEVYALHILLLALTFLALLHWDARPTGARFAIVLAIYALSFGNHLTSIMVAPALVAFIGWRRGWRFLVSRHTLALSAAIAGAGTLPYLWNLRTLWLAPLPPESLAEGLRQFWFDVTKADWRESMVGAVPAVMIPERLRMYAFDVQQQFGWLGPMVASIGMVSLVRAAPSRAALLAIAYLVTTLFALSYNVGDTHVFLLPSHFTLALAIAAGIAAVGRLARAHQQMGVAIASAVVAGAACIGAWNNYPSLDRSADTRPRDVLEALVRGTSERDTIVVADLNWQVDNGLNYFAKKFRDDVAYTRLADVLPHLPALVRDNREIGRHVLLAGETIPQTLASELGAAREAGDGAATLTQASRSIPRGARYVATILRPTRDTSIDALDLEQMLGVLTGGQPMPLSNEGFVVIAGLAGQDPSLIRSGDRPFRVSVELGGTPLTIRMESWLAFDTIRRMGFGHVIANRHHTLIVERGVSLAAFDEEGRPLKTVYAANIFEPIARYWVRTP